uniref:BtpA family membrane complex biogenesis protein n=1 Tax=Syphacia muris TaxID=451379 RepID=A0A0N5AG97_9BILA
MSSVQLLSKLWKITQFQRPFVIGMIHVPDGIMVENMHDVPYVQEADICPAITAHMTRACMAVNDALGNASNQFLRGVQILAAANQQAVAVAQACGFDFIRAECFTFSHVADEGLMSACAGKLLRYRHSIGADNIAIITDLKKKHSSHAITSDLSIGDVAKASEFFLADGLVITGKSTALKKENVFLEVQQHSKLPVFVGSGVTDKNVSYFKKADGLIVGSHFKENGYWMNRLDGRKVRNFMQLVRRLKREQ